MILWDTIFVNFEEEGNMLAIPNAFTPNGDIGNDYFEVTSTCYYVTEAHIYNMWNEKIKETIYSITIWDGISKGIACSTGAYYYFMTLKNDDGDLQPAHGRLTLIR